MHALLRVIAWVGIMLFIILSMHWTPKTEIAFRFAIALTFVIWLLVGGVWGLRGIWRILNS